MTMVNFALGYLGQVTLWLSLAAAIAAIVLLCAGCRGSRAGAVKAPAASKARSASAKASRPTKDIAVPTASPATRWGYVMVWVVAALLAIACLIIVVSFYGHNVAIRYVAQNYPSDTGSLFWLYLLSGLWASRAGSLLTWGFLIAAFAAWVAFQRRREMDGLSSVALAIVMVVVVLFLGVLLFSNSNNPFLLTDPAYIDADGNLTGSAKAWGMNVLLQHWAMAIHPPTLFIGYAGMTIPFAYGVATLILNDPSRRWIDLCNRIALFGFIFLSAGIGLGAVWAYVCLGWGGYWGWDPVENASLLSWLTAVAMIHSFTVFRKRDMMKGWALLSATLTFFFVIMGTFITRSGLVESVHAFSSDPVSVALFLAMMIMTIAALLIGWFTHRGAFASEDDMESMVSKNGSYYLTNLIMTFAAILLGYLTISSALPAWLPLGGMSVGTLSYETIARPLGIIFCLLAAVCPFLAWRKTDGAEFLRNIRIPLVIAAVLSVVLIIVWVTKLLPVYQSVIGQRSVAASDLAAMGPAWYYHGLAIFGLIVSALLAATSAYLIVRGVRARMANKGENALVAVGRLFAKAPAQAGGYLTHLGVGIVLAGLIGSSMYVTEVTKNVSSEGERFDIGSYTLTYEDSDRWQDDAGNRYYQVHVHAERAGEDLGTMTSVIELTAASNYGQSRYTSETRSTFLEDLFVVFQGYDSDGSAVINARVNPLISLVWIGFAVIVIGITCATWPKRGSAALKASEAAKAQGDAS